MILNRTGDETASSRWADELTQNGIQISKNVFSKAVSGKTTIRYRPESKELARKVSRILPGKQIAKPLGRDSNYSVVVVIGTDLLQSSGQQEESDSSSATVEEPRHKTARRPSRGSKGAWSDRFSVTGGVGTPYGGFGMGGEVALGDWRLLAGIGVYPSFLGIGEQSVGTRLSSAAGALRYLGGSVVRGFAEVTYGMLGAGRVRDKEIRFYGPALTGGVAWRFGRRSRYFGRAGVGIGIAERPLGPTLGLELMIGRGL